jgi:iron complex transport system substrate-binding protein
MSRQNEVSQALSLASTAAPKLIERRPGWGKLKAVQREHIFVADGNQYFNRPGPRIVESLEILAEIFHPEFFPSRYEA